MFVLTFAMLTAIVLYGLLFNKALFFTFAGMLGGYFLLERLYSMKAYMPFRRKIQIMTWSDSGDPTALAKLEVDMAPTDEFIAAYNKENPDKKLTYTTVALKALGVAMQKVKGSWGKLSFGNFVPAETVDVSVLVDVDGQNVVNTVVKNCESASIADMNAQMKKGVKVVKKKEDKDLNFQLKVFNILPTFVVKIILNTLSFINYELNLPVPAFKVKKNHFGNALLTNVSGFGLTDVYASHVPFTKSVCVCMLNAVKPEVVARDGEIVVRNMMNVNFLFDIRFFEVKELALVLKSVENVFKNPKTYLK